MLSCCGSAPSRRPGSAEPSAATIARYQRMAAQSGVEVTVRLCVCRTHREVVQWMVPRQALVVLGGRRRWWWPTREQRLVRHFQRAGHATVFALTSFWNRRHAEREVLATNLLRTTVHLERVR